MGRAAVPVGVHPVAQLQPHARGLRKYIADVSGFHAVLSDDPELPANMSDAYRSAAQLSSFATDGFEERIPRRCEAESEHKLAGEVTLDQLTKRSRKHHNSVTTGARAVVTISYSQCMARQYPKHAQL